MGTKEFCQDNSNNINPHTFDFIQNKANHEICNKFTKDRKLFLLIYVHTAPEHFENRNLLRQTWLNTTMYQNVRGKLIKKLRTFSIILFKTKTKIKIKLYLWQELQKAMKLINR